MAVGIVAERFINLRQDKILPHNLVADVWRMASTKQLTEDKVREIQQESALGRILAAGLMSRGQDRDSMKESIEEVGHHVVHDLNRNLNALGTIAAITPLMGLLGTVVGMIKVFTNITTVGVGNPAQLAGGISQALITTAGGLMVAIPALLFYRYFKGKIDELVVDMEKESLKLVDVLQKRQVKTRAAS
jgi:biopolymer transport protein ExbB